MRRVGAIVLAAGMSRRMGSANKLLIDFQGKPLVRWIVDALASCDLFQTLVITGHESGAVRPTINADFGRDGNGNVVISPGPWGSVPVVATNDEQYENLAAWAGV